MSEKCKTVEKSGNVGLLPVLRGFDGGLIPLFPSFSAQNGEITVRFMLKTQVKPHRW